MTTLNDTPAPADPDTLFDVTGHWGWLAGAIGMGLFVGAAIVLEVVGGSYANSPVPGYGELVPLAWPQWARVVWWLVVAAAAGGFRWCAHRYGLRQRPAIVMLTVAPFVAFALGIATGSEWATWH